MNPPYNEYFLIKNFIIKNVNVIPFTKICGDVSKLKKTEVT
jgi:hypothetical protein